jgi:hypothetical protein
MSRLKRDCRFFDHHVPLSRQTSNAVVVLTYGQGGQLPIAHNKMSDAVYFKNVIFIIQK